MDSTHSAGLAVTLALPRGVLPLHGSSSKEQNLEYPGHVAASLGQDEVKRKAGRPADPLSPVGYINLSQLVFCILL